MIGERMKQRIFTLRQIIEEGTAALEAVGIEKAEAALNAWYLLEYTAGVSRAAYYGNPDRVLDGAQVEKYLEAVVIRAERVPLQHITGEQEFMGYPFFVNGHVLIPRQDTETLVEEAVKVIRGMRSYGDAEGLQRRAEAEGLQSGGKEAMQVLDLCTGSGCILLSLMKLCPEICGIGCDISEEALEVARKNAGRLDVRADWIRSDLFGELDGRYDLIVSNPPYIPTADIEGLQEEVRFHDPRIALDGGEDGLHFYRRIIEESPSYIKDGGSLLFEIGCDQGEAVAGLMKDHGYVSVAVKKDLSGLDRVIMGIYNGKNS